MYRVTNYWITVVSIFSNIFQTLVLVNHTPHTCGTKQCLEHQNMPSYACCRCMLVVQCVSVPVCRAQHTHILYMLLQWMTLYNYMFRVISVLTALWFSWPWQEEEEEEEEKELGDDEMEPVATSCRRSDTEWQDCHRWAETADWLGLGHSTPSPAGESGYWRTNSGH